MAVSRLRILVATSLAPLLALATACGDDTPGGAPHDDEAATSSDATTSGSGDTGGGSATSTAPSGSGGSGGEGGAGGSAGGGASGGAGAGGSGGAPPEDVGPEMYPGGRVHSPITLHVAERLRALAAEAPTSQADVFMKVGASSTVSRSTLFCFDGGVVDLGAHEDLRATLDFFLGGDAAGTTPFGRESLAAESGRTASWAISGDPSPLERERDAIDPRIALIHYGTNDMEAGVTYESALVAFYAKLSTLVGDLESSGAVPILFGITRRGEDAAAERWVSTFNAAIRGIAQREQIPFVDLFAAIDPLAGHGLSGDGLHLEAYAGGACVLDEAGLAHGYNTRNLVALESLDRTRSVLQSSDLSLDDPAPRLEGTGAAATPFRIQALPFAHTANTLTGERTIDAYPLCGSNADESGPELWYALDLDALAPGGAGRRIRAVVLDRDGVDVDVHLIGSSADECVARGHHTVEAALAAGSFHLVVDSFVDGGGVEKGGEYTLVVVECDDDDDDCGALP